MRILELFRDDVIADSIWEDICQALNIEPDTDVINISIGSDGVKSFKTYKEYSQHICNNYSEYTEEEAG